MKESDLNFCILKLSELKLKYENNVNILREDMRTLKDMFQKKTKNISALIRKNNSIYTSLNLQTIRLLKKLRKTEENYNKCKQLQIQSNDQIMILENTVDNLEDELAYTQIDKDELQEKYDNFKNRFDFVQEARVHEMIDGQQNLEEIKNTLSDKVFNDSLRSVQDTIISMQNLLSLSEEGNCVVCKNRRANHIIIPCGHQCLCHNCSYAIGDTCPYCKSLLTSINKVYMV